MAWRQRVVVVGAGFGGIAVTRALRKERCDRYLIRALANRPRTSRRAQYRHNEQRKGR